MLLNFYVQGHTPGSSRQAYAEGEGDGVLSRLSHKVQGTVETLQEMSVEDMKDEAMKRGQRVADMGRGMFRFLTGAEDAQATPQFAPVPEQKPAKEESGWISSVTGLFSGIKGSSRSGGSSSDTWNGPAFTEGEVHADLVMVRIFLHLFSRK